MNLTNYLDTKPLYYEKIDYERFPKAYKSIKEALHLPRIIHVVGTNGKGSTGRFLAQLLIKKGFITAHYSSPHILKFNERIWLNGADVSDEVLENTHKELQKILDKEIAETLSYFEYTTLLAMIVFKECDYVVLEAGLGGEFDATNVFDKELSIFTPIGYDHSAFLGTQIDQIATTKLNSMTNIALMAKQPFEDVLKIAKEISNKKETKLYSVEDFTFDQLILDEISSNNMPQYLKENLLTSLCALKLLGFEPNSTDVKNLDVIFGRLSRLKDHIYVDVGHNVLAAEVIAKSLEHMKVVLIYNSFKDKEYAEILHILKPIIKYVEIINVDDKRVVDKEELKRVLNSLHIEFRDFEKTKESENYLVFGSFSVVEKFLKMEHLYLSSASNEASFSATVASVVK